MVRWVTALNEEFVSLRYRYFILASLLLWCIPTLAAEGRKGFVLDVPVPLDGRSADRLLADLDHLAKSAPAGGRVDVVLRYGSEVSGGESTAFEDALKVARAITGDRLRSVRAISLVQGKLSGHTVLPVLASDSLLVSAGAEISDATAGDSNADETVRLSYESIAAKRGVFPVSVVRALINPDVQLAWVSLVDGTERFAAGAELVKLRETGKVLSDDVWSASGAAASFSASQLRSSRIAAGLVESLDEAADVLDLSEIRTTESQSISGEAKGVLLEIAGSISGSRVRRWQSNLSGSLAKQDINTWLVTLDSVGGDIDQSASLASQFALAEPPLRTVAGYVTSEARSDSALIALACKPLYLHPESSLGGIGADQITVRDIENHGELIDTIAKATKRPVGLIRGLLCSDLEVYRYTNKKTGKVKYSTPEDLVAFSDEPELERQRWEQGERMELTEGLSADQAIELGLAEGKGSSLEEVSRQIGLNGIPELVSDRGLVRFVERLGRSQGLMVLLLMVGFVALSAEMNAPGLGAPGFLAMVCFGLFFWMSYLAGTAEWLELVLLILGLGCIFMEIFVIPGFGIFGIGGLVMTIASIVLMSQTFVLPQNSYQLGVITRGLWAALGSILGLFGGFVLMRQFFPHVPLFRHLVMEAPDSEAIHHAEKLADYSFLLDQKGVTTTPLRPSGKAKFGDEIVQVISDGALIEKGAQVTVIDVQGAKVVVEG